MNKNFTLLVFLFSLLSFSQEVQKNSDLSAIPTYYNGINGTGFALKTQLKTLITNGHVDQGYGALWSLFTNPAFRDNVYENDGSLLDFYSENPIGPDPYNYTSTSQQCGTYSGEGGCYNREHLIPQAYFDNVTIEFVRNDPFHVVPADGKVNAIRDNYPFSRVATASLTTNNGSKLGSNVNSGYSAGYSNFVFEPLDEFKGDIARCFFYFATRYQDLMDDFYNSTNVDSKNMFDGSINNVFNTTFLNVFITWHNQDPVSAKEIAKNNAIFSFQGNRNPFIDRPEYVCQIWGSACAALNNPSIEFASISVYPNPSSDNKINIDSEIYIDNIQLINLNGQLIKEIKNPVFTNNSYSLENLPQGFYFLRLTSQNKTITKKVVIN